MMKLFEYKYDLRYGNGQGVILANSMDEAEKMLREQIRSLPELEIEEIDITKPQVIDHSWEE
jgi:hypothetical protein